MGYSSRYCLLALLSVSVAMAQPMSGKICEFGEPCDTAQLANEAVTVCCFGEPPHDSTGEQRCVCGAEFQVSRSPSQSQPGLRIGSWSEAEPEVCYRVDGTAFVLVDKTWDPRHTDFVEFTERRISVVDGRPKCEFRLLIDLPPDGGSARSVLLSDLALSHDALYASHGDQIGSFVEQALYEIRNLGLRDPSATLAELRSLHGSWWCDGQLAEVLSGVEAELETVLRGRTGQCPGMDR